MSVLVEIFALRPHQIFGLFRLLGLSLQPWLAKLRQRRLFKLSKDRHYGELEPLFDGSVPEDLIREQWDGLMRSCSDWRMPAGRIGSPRR
jgi:TnpA family transposase